MALEQGNDGLPLPEGSDADNVNVHEDLDSHLSSRWRDARTRRHEKVITRHEAEAVAMSWWKRMRVKFRTRMSKHHPDSSLSEQYCVPPEKESLWNAILERRNRKRKRLTSLSSFQVLIAHFLIIYFFAVLVSAILLQGLQAVYYDKGQECITNYDYSDVSIATTDNFIVLFGLCWTTFSTVGYGVIGVSTEDGCQGMRYYLAVVAFLGVMYSGYSGSILFSTLSVYLGRAHVTFSSCICLQFGEGVSGPRVTFGKETNDERVNRDGGESIPGQFPVIQMRLVNDRPGKQSAIANANLQCIAITSEDLDADAFASKQSHGLAYHINDGIDNPEARNGAQVTVCRDVKISPTHSPYFFDGAWYVDHTLDHNSPLLKESVRERIIENSNEWPSDLNEWSKIRASLSEKVDYIVLVLHGVSALTLSNIFETVYYAMSDVYVGYTFAEMGYISARKAKGGHGHSAIQYDTSLIHDIRPQTGGGNEPLGIGSHHRDVETDRTTGVVRHYMSRHGRRRSYDHLQRPQNLSMAMESITRRRMRLSAKLSCCTGTKSTAAANAPSDQYVIPPRGEKRKCLTIGIVPHHWIVNFTIWLYRTNMMVSLIAFLTGYFVLIWIFAIVLWAVDPECLSGWSSVPGGFAASFYIPFQASWTTFSTVGYGGVAPIAGIPCRGLSVVLAGEAFLGVIYSSYCGAVFYAKISRSETFANVSFSHPICLQYNHGRDADAESKDLNTRLKMKTSENAGVLSFPFMEMRAVNEEAQYKVMKGEILNASIRCYVSSFQLKPHSDSSRSSDETKEGDLAANPSKVITGAEWRRRVDDLSLSPNHQVVLGKAPWSFRHTLDDTSPMLLPEVRRRIKELGGWPADLNTAEKIRLCISPHIDTLHILFQGTANNTAQKVIQLHEYKPKDIFLGWKFAGMAYLVESKQNDGETKCQVNFDLALFNDILPQGKGEAEAIVSNEDGH